MAIQQNTDGEWTRKLLVNQESSDDLYEKHLSDFNTVFTLGEECLHLQLLLCQCFICVSLCNKIYDIYNFVTLKMHLHSNK